MSDRVTIRDLAKIAGVSRTTVSLALRDSHQISEATRRKIQDLARRHDYRSHPAVSALMQQVGRGGRIHDEEIIAFIRSGADPEERSAGPLEILRGVREEAHRLGYKVEVFWAGPGGVNSEKLGQTLYHRGIRGVIWGPMPYPHPQIRFPWQHFVPIACTSSTDVPNLPVACIHHAKGMALVIGELYARGARRIGFVQSYQEDLRQDFTWLLGVDLHRHRGGKATVATLALRGDYDEKPVRTWVRQQKLDALILTQDLFDKVQPMALGLPRASLDVPSSELGRIGGLFQDIAKIGQHAVRSMSGRLVNGNLGLPESPFSIVTQASFVEGDSLGPLQRRNPDSAAPITATAPRP